MRGVILRVLTRNFESFLDVGCGKGPLSLLLRYHGINVQSSVGVDLFRNYLYTCKAGKLYDELVLADAAHLPFKPRSFDIVFLGDTIEHLNKDDGGKLLLDAEYIARKQVLVSTPVGFRKSLRKGRRGQDSVEALLMKHKSSWLPQEFRVRNYAVRGDVMGVPFLRQSLGYYLSAILPMTYFLPEISYHMVCVKNIEEARC